MQIEDKETFFLNYIASHERNLKGFLWKKLHNEDLISDILQTTYLKAWAKLENLKSKESAKSWLFKIAKNEVTQYWRKNIPLISRMYVKKTDQEEDIIDTLIDEEEPIMREIVDKFEKELAFKALDYLTNEERDLLHMRCIDELQYKEIANITKIKEKTLSSKMCRILKKYRNIYFSLENGGDGNV